MDDVKKDRLVVYTALFGDYDELIDPPEMFSGCDFVCFTDQAHLKSDIWEVRLIKDCDLPPNMMNRRYKILPHLFFPEYQHSLYVDANVRILRNPNYLVAKYLSRFDFVAPKHFARDCIYDEAFVLIRSGRVEIKKLYLQTCRFLKNGYICQTKMTENNVLLRNHNKLFELSQGWWDVFIAGASRDQLSLAYVAWRHGVNIEICDEISARIDNLFSIRPHKIIISAPRIVKFIRLLLLGWPYMVFVKLLVGLKKND